MHPIEKLFKKLDESKLTLRLFRDRPKNLQPSVLPPTPPKTKREGHKISFLIIDDLPNDDG